MRSIQAQIPKKGHPYLRKNADPAAAGQRFVLHRIKEKLGNDNGARNSYQNRKKGSEKIKTIK